MSIYVELLDYEKWFRYKHLREDLQEISKPFCELAINMINNWPRNHQTQMALNHLLIAKDAAVRARL